MPFTTTERNKILDCYLNQTNITAPTAIFISLHTADPGNTGASEVSGGSYARTVATTNFPAASSGSCANDVAIQFPTATGSWGTVTHVEIWSASSAGTFYGGGSLTTSKAVASGDTASFATSGLTVSIA